MLISKLCDEKDFETEWFISSCKQLKLALMYNRKYWEWCYIYQALLERSVLMPNKRGLGFGVGKEPLVSLFASYGCEITATDLDFEKAKAAGWVDTINPETVLELNSGELCNKAQFQTLVTFESVDMNQIGDRYANGFDFTWSACSLDHLGTIELGKQFILNQMNCLKPGGISVHTTEFNLSSNEDTVDKGPTVLFRRRDIEELVQGLRNGGYSIEVDYCVGNGKMESCVDTPPYRSSPHIRLQIYRYVCSSFGLIIEKGKECGDKR